MKEEEEEEEAVEIIGGGMPFNLPTKGEQIWQEPLSKPSSRDRKSVV